MHLKRAESGLHLPIPRKGTKYLARAASHAKGGIPVVIAVRDILGLARTSKEVRQMVNQGLLKLNGKVVKDIREGIRLSNVLEADKQYALQVLPTGRFTFVETKRDTRLCKVVGKTMLPKGKIQLNLHDGSNVIGKKSVKVGDSVTLTMEGKLKDVFALDKGTHVLVTSGSKVGQEGKIKTLNEDNTVTLEIEGGASTIPQAGVMALK